MAEGDAPTSRITTAASIPLMTAIIGGVLALAGSIWVSYVNSESALVIEREKFKTNLILEAVKVGDKQKALENLTFFVDAGFLDDPNGKIKGLLDRNVLPVLPKVTQSGDTYSFDDSVGVMQSFTKKAGLERAREGDSLAAKGEADAALVSYKAALVFLENLNCDDPAAEVVREKIGKLPGRPFIPLCDKHPPRIFPPVDK
jgi:hypothetical protein